MRAIAIVLGVLLLAQGRGPAAGPAGAEPLSILNAERAWSSADALWLLLNTANNIDKDAGPYIIRAIGRVEDPQQVRALMSLQKHPTARGAAIAQSLYGFDPAKDPELLALVEQWFRVTANEPPDFEKRMAATAGLAAPMSHIVYATPEQVQDVASMLAKLADFSANSLSYGSMYVQAIRGFEALARVNTKLVAYDETAIGPLKKCVRNQPVNAASPETRLSAFMALAAARVLDADTEKEALGDEGKGAWVVRRAAMRVLAGAGAGLDEDARVAAIRDGLSDEDAHVRYEAVRAWALRAARQHGCQPLLDAFKDDDATVVLEAIDQLGTACPGNEDVTRMLEAEAVTPPASGPWQRPTHAFASLSKRSSEKAAILMGAFTGHQVWWVRMYAAYAAGGARDVLRLDKLAYDENDNVREAALQHLRALDPQRAERAILAALERTDVQLVRSAAGMIKEWPASARNVRPLLDSLQRLTRTRSMTSRDARTALLDAIEHHGRSEDHTDLVPWLKDFDPFVAGRAADAILHLSGKVMKAEPIVAPHIPVQPFENLRQCVTIEMSPGRPIKLRMLPDLAPIAVETFLKLAIQDRYYNGLTFHRIVPNFVIQGGSPGANEYSGRPEFMRDEIAGSNVRGTVGLSTRGRNTGDGQFFINLVDNPRLDGNYTVFAAVENMDAVDRVQEGDVMRTITAQPLTGAPCR